MSHWVSRGTPCAGTAEGKQGDRSHPTRTCSFHSQGGPHLPTRPSSARTQEQRPQPRHFLFHLMGIRPDSRAVRLAIFRVRLCNFVEGVTKEGPYLFPQGGKDRLGKTAFGDLAGGWEIWGHPKRWPRQKDLIISWGSGSSQNLCQKHPFLSASISPEQMWDVPFRKVRSR